MNQETVVAVVPPKPITFATCQAWARAIIKVRGMPPYKIDDDIGAESIQDLEAHDEAILALINDFCEHWKNKL